MAREMLDNDIMCLVIINKVANPIYNYPVKSTVLLNLSQYIS